MTRRRIIAGVILLAAVVVAVPFGPSVWRSFGYRNVWSAGEMVLLVKRWDWFPGESPILPDQTCDYCASGRHAACLGDAAPEGTLVVFLSKSGGFRASVFRGGFFGFGRSRLGLVRQVEAASGRGSFPVIRPSPGVFEVPTGFRCTCTDPSHDGDR